MNLFIGAGIVKWMGPGDLIYRDVGECDQFTLNPTVERKEYRTRRDSTRRVVRSVTTDQGCEVSITFKEPNAANLALHVLGLLEAPVAPATYSTIWMMRTPDLTGFIRFVGTTVIGEPAQVDAKVNLMPNGENDLLIDDWGGFQMLGSVVQDAVDHYDFGRILIPITAEVEDTP
jgi:hypothetical protein